LTARAETPAELTPAAPDGAAALDPSLDARACRTGRDWATRVREVYVAERRAPSGGWPGTMTEARARVGLALDRDSASRGWDGLTVSQRETVARLIYSSARSTWMGLREPDRGDDQETG